MKKQLLVATCVAALLVFSAGYAEDKKEKAVNYEKMSTTKLRKASEKAAEDFYAMFNSLNDEDDFMVRCDYERPTGSRRKTHVCTARFITDAQTEHAERNWDNRMDASGNMVSNDLETKAAAFEQKISSLVGANPELAEKLAHYNNLVTMVAERAKR